MITDGISVVVPVFNSADTIFELVERISKVLTNEHQKFEIILVDDGSRDESWKQIVAVSESRSTVVPTRLTRNFGQHNALLCGLRKARFATTVTIDDDLQHPPEEIPRLLTRLGEADVVYGAPTKQQHGLLRNLASTMTKIALSGGMGAENARHLSAFRAFRTSLRDGFEGFSAPNVSIDVLLTWATSRFTYIEVEHHPRAQGTSNYTVRRLLAHALNMITGFSILPLQIASILGLSATLFGGGLLAYLLVRWAIGGVIVPGFTFIASAIVLFGGVQLFALGLIGEYIARIHVRSMGRPAYLEDRETESPSAPDDPA
ncbi:MAG TPA: glycosyltransferase family 2 protein [Acidimicrobiia bacterium]|nr:glycosyltransferase family 2 protein [Acidimicrobiia bacterium]